MLLFSLAIVLGYVALATIGGWVAANCFVQGFRR